MSGAIRLQQHTSRSRRVLAAVTGLWLVAFGVLGARHESQVAHYVDARTGVVLHASAMASHHRCQQSDIHATRGATTDDVCGVAQTLHQASSPAVAHVQIASAVSFALDLVSSPTRSTTAQRHVLRLAPKTSPPLAA